MDDVGVMYSSCRRTSADEFALPGAERGVTSRGFGTPKYSTPKPIIRALRRAPPA
jgi:hypothetical protein